MSGKPLSKRVKEALRDGRSWRDIVEEYEAEATSGGVMTDGLREALEKAERLWARGTGDRPAAYWMLRSAVEAALSTTPPAPDDFYVDTITDANGDELERGAPDPPAPEMSMQTPRSTV